MRPGAETGSRDGTPDTLGIVDVYASMSAGQAAFTGRTSAAALDARCGYQNVKCASPPRLSRKLDEPWPCAHGTFCTLGRCAGF